MAVYKQHASTSRKFAVQICGSWEIPHEWSEVVLYEYQKPFESSLKLLLETGISHIHTDSA